MKNSLFLTMLTVSFSMFGCAAGVDPSGDEVARTTVERDGVEIGAVELANGDVIAELTDTTGELVAVLSVTAGDREARFTSGDRVDSWPMGFDGLSLDQRFMVATDLVYSRWAGTDEIQAGISAGCNEYGCWINGGTGSTWWAYCTYAGQCEYYF